MDNAIILSTWYEMGGLAKGKINFVFTIFKLCSIFGITSIPFWFAFDRLNYEISDITFGLRYDWLWLYYLASFGMISTQIIKVLYHNLNMIESSDIFEFHNINTTEGATIEKMASHLNLSKEEFLMKANKLDNILLACEEKQYLNTSFFTNMLGTYPLEVATKYLIDSYFFGAYTLDNRTEILPYNLEENRNQYKNLDQNNRDFKQYCRKTAIVLIPFIPTLIVLLGCNHILTYFNNMMFLHNYDYNRVALWRFRYYNEFLVSTRKRLDKTKASAEAVLSNMYLENWKSSFSRGLSFLFSVISVILIIFSFAGFERLFNIDIIPIIASSIFLSTTLFTKRGYRDYNLSTIRTLLKKDITKYELTLYFESKIFILIKEVLSLLYLPIMLYFVLPDRSYFIANFINSYTRDKICTFAAWTNQNCTPKTKSSFFATSMDLAGSDILVSL